MIVVLRGPPGAGKTTIATRLRERLAERGPSVELLHSDDFTRIRMRRTPDCSTGRSTGASGASASGVWTTCGWSTSPRASKHVSSETASDRKPMGETGVHVVYREFERPRTALTIG